FSSVRTPHPIEHLSDNGSPYTAKETLDFATALNLVPCFTPVKSPESKGMSEAFVKTFKRNYLRISPLPDAPTVLRQIAGWIDEYILRSILIQRSGCAPRGSSSAPKPSSRVSGETGGTTSPWDGGFLKLRRWMGLAFGKLALTEDLSLNF